MFVRITKKQPNTKWRRFPVEIATLTLKCNIHRALALHVRLIACYNASTLVAGKAAEVSLAIGFGSICSLTNYTNINKIPTNSYLGQACGQVDAYFAPAHRSLQPRLTSAPSDASL